jgi:hypothetical protein
VVEYGVQQCVFLYKLYVKCVSARKCYFTVLSTTGMYKPTKNGRLLGYFCTRNLLEETLYAYWRNPRYEIGAGLEHMSQKSLRCLLQDMAILKSSAARVMKLLRFQPYEVTVAHALPPCDLASTINFFCWFLQSVSDSEVNCDVTFLLMKHGCICVDMFPSKLISTGV